MINHIKNNVQRNVIYRKVNMNDLNSRAAAMSYYLLLSIFPFLIFMINLIGYIPIIHINRFIGTYEGLLPNVAYVTVQTIIESAINDRNISLTVVVIDRNISKNIFSLTVQKFNFVCYLYERKNDKSFS